MCGLMLQLLLEDAPDVESLLLEDMLAGTAGTMAYTLRALREDRHELVVVACAAGLLVQLAAVLRDAARVLAVCLVRSSSNC